MKVTIITHTPEPERVVAAAAKLCYSAASIADIAAIEADKASEFIEKLPEAHQSPFEHVSFTFGIEGVSRAMMAQITRQRIASFSVQSQRYVEMDGFAYVKPPSIAEKPEAAAMYDRCMEMLDVYYSYFRSFGIPAEDARYVLPNACTTQMLVTMNARELLHFFSLRCCQRAQWEIRAVADEMLRLCREVAPTIFAKAGPGCVRGHCPEGKMGCGKEDNHATGTENRN